MSQANKTEFWLRGPIEGIPSLLQPVAHALLQAKQEVAEMTGAFPDDLLWKRPAGMASAGFHLLHLVGVLDRLFTYAKGYLLQPSQLEYLKQETEPQPVGTRLLADRFYQQVDKALQQLLATDEKTLTDVRGVGRKQLPSTVIGLLFHAAEHTQRHVGQLLVTVNVVRETHRQ